MRRQTGHRRTVTEEAETERRDENGAASSTEGAETLG
jgi:hypothetical protein